MCSPFLLFWSWFGLVKLYFKKKKIMENFHFLIWNSIFAFWVFVFVGFVAMDHLEAFEIVNEFFHGYNIGC